MKFVEDEIEDDLYDVEKIVLTVVPVIFLCASYLALRFLTTKRQYDPCPHDESVHQHKD